MPILPPHKPSQEPREHEHLFHLLREGDVLARWCRSCGVTDILERKDGEWTWRWRRVEEENAADESSDNPISTI